jgi:excisionase family DNA binding protein
VQPENTPEWITYEEAQRLTSLGRTTLWKIANSNQGLKTARVGTAVRINRKSLEEFMERMASNHTIAH